jgi:hypothetical protein
MLEFLGFGLLQPFQRDGRADWVAAGGEPLIRSAVGQILGTIGASDKPRARCRSGPILARSCTV